MIKDRFYVPKYYKEFKCKGGDCKNTCCKEWNITLTMTDYDKLANLECSDQLKEKIKNGVSIFNNATTERYAKIDLNYYGECKLRLENGYCGLQCECGEENIPSVCRYYPRAPRLKPVKQCVISLSCEWVLEYLIKDTNKLEFEYQDLSFFFDKQDEEIKCPQDFLTLRDNSINILTNRSISLMDRFSNLFKYFNIELNNDTEYNKKMIESLSNFYTHSFSICDFIKVDNVNNYKDVYNELKNNVNNFDIYLEKILINHIIYMNFPYIEFNETFDKSLYGLYYIFLFINQLLYNNIDNLDLPNILSHFFRVAEHANMYEIIYNLKKRIDLERKNN